MAGKWASESILWKQDVNPRELHLRRCWSIRELEEQILKPQGHAHDRRQAGRNDGGRAGEGMRGFRKKVFGRRDDRDSPEPRPNASGPNRITPIRNHRERRQEVPLGPGEKIRR
ncbi:hypothetical protein F5Y13DRAFT_165703 [Hypoxylon sp. FL1857]|nr:hypothetical protein F5Y13DRAFT_165703 [Hypoxylon sp. FL1857]